MRRSVLRPPQIVRFLFRRAEDSTLFSTFPNFSLEGSILTDVFPYDGREGKAIAESSQFTMLQSSLDKVLDWGQDGRRDLAAFGLG